MVAEVDYTRFHSTGVTVVVDDGGDASADGFERLRLADAGRPAGRADSARDAEPPAAAGQRRPAVPDRIRRGNAVPPARGLPGLHRPEHGHAVGQGALRDARQHSPKTSTSRRSTTSRVRGDIDANGDGFFNTDHFNGGIAGIVHYGITRAENDPRWAAAENWEPGVSDVRVQLWDANRTHLLNEVTTDNWNNSVPAGCQWPTTGPDAGGSCTRDARRTASTGCATSTRRARRCSTAATRSARSCQDTRQPAGRRRSTTRSPLRHRVGTSAAQEADPGRQVRRQDHRAARVQAPEGRRQERRLRRHATSRSSSGWRGTRWPTAA